MPPKFKSGDRVRWEYTHATGRAKFRRAKDGEYIARARYRPGGLRGELRYHDSLVLVWFDGNKRWSRVEASELRLIGGN